MGDIDLDIQQTTVCFSGLLCMHILILVAGVLHRILHGIFTPIGSTFIESCLAAI